MSTRTRLNPHARDALREAGISMAAWLRVFPGCDVCGCSDDRCTGGYHHETYEECECLPVYVSDYLAGIYSYVGGPAGPGDLTR